MAADEAEERTEPATPQKREESRKEGRVAKSTDLTAAVALLGGLILLNLFGPGMFQRLLAIMQKLGEPPDVRAEALPIWIQNIGIATAWIVVPFILLLVVVTAVAALTQTGAMFSWTMLQPKLEHLDPVKGAKRLMSTESITRLGQSLVKTAIIGAVAVQTLMSQIGPLLGLGQLHPTDLLTVGGGLLFTLALRLGLILLLLGLIDYFYQRWKFEKSIRMSKQEIKDEMKRMDGDPMIKQRRRQTQMKIAMQRLRMDVPKADVIVTNPTEYAVALKYDQSAMSAPRVVAKGTDFLALRIRQIAQEHGIPIVQRPPLARGLYAAVDVGDEIPANFYRAVAEVLAYVFQLSGRAA
ncbi:MAG: flagellar biosynthesis protein FlhB [Phycisphaerae bacterium]